MSNTMYMDRLMVNVALGSAITVATTVALHVADEQVSGFPHLDAIRLVLLALAISTVLGLGVPWLLRLVRREHLIFSGRELDAAMWKGRALGVVVGAWLSIALLAMLG